MVTHRLPPLRVPLHTQRAPDPPLLGQVAHPDHGTSSGSSPRNVSTYRTVHKIHCCRRRDTDLIKAVLVLIHVG
ncbi:hypothetical protein ACQPZQ_23755 [Pseudonocardia sp. CA-142604]|uniref:hypothetical protein n=1 Tax=Pseudonocardia sp. CA-142604 TaxID=3240024 RepID=UPI003D8AD86C